MDNESSKLTGPISETEKKKKTVRSRIYLAIEIVLTIVIVLTLFPLGIIAYRNLAFGDTFFVNGMSMYPTLNGDALRKDGDSFRKLQWGDGNSILGDILDYGWGKRNSDNSEFYASLKRYDVVMCYYSKDYSNLASRTLRASASLKVKRIIGLPGETVNISYDPANTDKMENVFGYTVWGQTTITQKDGTVITLKNLYSADDYPTYSERYGSRAYLDTGNPVISSAAPNQARTLETKLGDDEYFVCGDNRRYSDDSRSEGGVKSFMIFGKACLVTGKREYLGSSSQDTAGFRLDMVRMPWDYINLEGAEW